MKNITIFLPVRVQRVKSKNGEGSKKIGFDTETKNLGITGPIIPN